MVYNFTQKSRTLRAARILMKFAHTICGCGREWTPENIIDDAINRSGSSRRRESTSWTLWRCGLIRRRALLNKAIGDQLVCVFVDNGLLRLNEGAQVMDTFAKNLGVRVIRANAEERFLAR